MPVVAGMMPRGVADRCGRPGQEYAPAARRARAEPGGARHDWEINRTCLQQRERVVRPSQECRCFTLV
jgi:hypothetical protein